MDEKKKVESGRMVLILSGGYNKYDQESERGSVLYRYEKEVKRRVADGERVVFVGSAKPDSFGYEEMIRLWAPGEVEYVGEGLGEGERVAWEKYDMIFLLGGDNMLLKARLEKSGFGLNKLKNGSKVVGDSAGGNMLAKKFVDDGEGLKVEDGFNPGSGVLCVPHWRNKKYTSEEKQRRARKYARENGLIGVFLDENEEKTLVHREGVREVL